MFGPVAEMKRAIISKQTSHSVPNSLLLFLLGEHRLPDSGADKKKHAGALPLLL